LSDYISLLIFIVLLFVTTMKLTDFTAGQCNANIREGTPAIPYKSGGQVLTARGLNKRGHYMYYIFISVSLQSGDEQLPLR
jgi:hypothetical protein